MPHLASPVIGVASPQAVVHLLSYNGVGEGSIKGGDGASYGVLPRVGVCSLPPFVDVPQATSWVFVGWRGVAEGVCLLALLVLRNISKTQKIHTWNI